MPAAMRLAGCERRMLVGGGLRGRRIRLLVDGVVAAPGPVKLWDIGTLRQGDAHFALMPRILVILRHPLANLRRSHANDGIYGRVVFRISAEDLDSQSAFLDILRRAGQRLFDHKAQKDREPPAVAEKDRKSTRLN